MTTSNENQIPTPLEISEFKTALARGFKSGERKKQIPTPLEISEFKDACAREFKGISEEMTTELTDGILGIIEFKSALERGFKSGETNAGILRWVFVGSRAVGFIPTQWAHKLLESGEFDDLNWHSSPNIEPPVMITQYSMLPAKRRKAVRSTITK